MSQVQVYGGLASTFGLAISDTVTPTGQSFACVPLSGAAWPLPAGTGNWFGVAGADGFTFAYGSMALTDNELQPTMLQTTMFFWNTQTQQLQAVKVPTTTGVFNPPGLNGASGTTIDMIRSVTIGGVNYVFAVGEAGYQGWQIATYGQPYWLMAFKETNGVWAFDPTHSYTAQQLAASSAAGATAFPTTTNSFGETVYTSLGPVCMILMPNSGDLLMGNYFYRSGHHSGSIVSLSPGTGTVKGFFEYPDITDTSNVPVNLSVRDLTVNPTSVAGDERFIMTPDVFVRSGGANYGLSPLMEMTYDGAGGISIKSRPMTPSTMPGVGFSNDYNLAQYDGQGNLWCPTHGGTGLAVFHAREMHVFEASGPNIPTFEDGGPAANWFAGTAGQFPTVTSADFRFGSFAIAQGFDCSVNWDDARERMVVTTIGGQLIGANLDTPALALGPEMAVNGGLTSGTTGWNGFFNSTLATATDSDFVSGKCLLLTSTSGTANVASQAVTNVVPNRNYLLTAQVKGVTTPRVVTVEMWWHDTNGALISTSNSPTVTMTSTGIINVECLAAAPANAAGGFLLINITAGSVGEQYKVGTVSWKSCPALTTPIVDTNKTRVTSGASGSVFMNKGEILGSTLYSTMISLGTSYPGDVGQAIPQFLTAVDLTTLGAPAPLQLPTMSLEIAFSNGPLDTTPVWTEIAPDLLGHTIQVGRQHQLDRVNPSTLKGSLDNRAGNYSPWDTTSPYYNLLTSTDSNFETAAGSASAGSWAATAGTLTPSTITHLYGGSAAELTASGTQETIVNGKYACTGGAQYSAGAYLIDGGTPEAFEVGLNFYTSGGSLIGSTIFGSPITDNNATWTQGTVTATAPSNATQMAVVVSSVATTSHIHFVDCVMLCLNPSNPTPASVGWTLGQTLPLVPGKPVRVREMWAATLHPRFYGFIDAVTPVPTDPLNQTATLDASDVLKLLNLKLLQNSTLYPTQVNSLSPLAYWRLNDPVGSLYATDSSGNGRNAAYAGPPTFLQPGAQFYDPNCAVTLTNGGTTPFGGSWVQAPVMPGQGGAGGFSFECWFKTTAIEQQIFTWGANAGTFPTAVWLGVDANGHLGLFDGNAQVAPWAGVTEEIASVAPVNDGNWHHAVVTMSAPTTSSTWTVYLDGASIGGWAGEYWSETFAAPLYVGGLFSLVSGIGGPVGTFDGAIDEVAVYGSVFTGANVTANYTVGSYFQNVEYTGQRIAKALIVAGFGSFPQNLATGSVLCQPETSSMTQTLCGDYCLGANDTENGLFYQDASGTVQFKDRHYPQTNPTTTTSQATLGDNTGTQFHYDVTGLTIPQDDLDLWPDVQTQRNNGVLQEVLNAASAKLYGYRTLQRTGLLMDSDNDALYLGQWLSYLYNSPLIRASAVLLSSLANGGANLPIMLGANLWDCFTLQRQGQGESQLHELNVLEGFTEVFDAAAGTLKTTWQLSPFEVSAAANLALIISSSTNGILDTNVIGG